MVRIRPVRVTPVAGWPSGLRRQFKALVSSEARVRISLQSLFDPFPPWGMQKMRHPGIEPGPPRWQRGIITTRLMTLRGMKPLSAIAEWRSGSALGS